MKKAFALAAFAFVSLVTTSAYAQSTISPVPGGKDTPHEPTPTSAPDQQITGQTRSDGQLMPANRGQNKGNKMSGDKAARKQMRKQKSTTTTGSM